MSKYYQRNVSAPFNILVLYNGEMIIATASEIDEAGRLEYLVKFSDGYKNLFHSSGTENSKHWTESNLNATDLAASVGQAIDQTIAGKYLEPFFQKVDEIYAIQPIRSEDRKLKFKIYKLNGDFLFTIYFGDDWVWKVEIEGDLNGNSFKGDSHLVYKIGMSIELYQANHTQRIS